MLRPSPGELLAGLRQSLEADVLPALPRGAAQQQLKAGLHLIGRLVACWDRAGAHLAADNSDIETVLGKIDPKGLAELEQSASDVDGFTNQTMRRMAARNAALHDLLLTQSDSSELRALFGRMAARDSAYVGDAPLPDQDNTE